jgi:hypothetical protein
MSRENLADHTRRRDAFARSALPGELHRLWLLARKRLASGARPWLGITATMAAAIVSLFLHFHIFGAELWRTGDVYAALPLTSELARLPLSLVFPTAYLPLWAACAQLLVVIGLGELMLGRWLTIVVAMGGHVGSTLFARVLMDSIHRPIFALTPALAHVLDTGPSAATTAVGACLLISVKMNRCVLLLSVGLVVAALVAPGVDGFEHATAMVWGVTVGVANNLVLSKAGEIREVTARTVSRLRNPRRRSAMGPLQYVGRARDTV